MEYRKISEIKKLENNPRTIDKKSFGTLCESVKNNKDYFEARPLILSDRTGELVIIAGNQRYEAAKSLGMQEVPTHLITGLTERREQEIIIRDNINNGVFDWDMLANNYEVGDLLEWGFSENELKIEQEVVEDEAPEVAEGEAVSKLGEVYQLGRHRLMCGDSTKIEDVEKLMDGKKAQMIMADPPYNVGYVGGSTNKKDRSDSYRDVWTDGQYTEWLKSILTNAFVASDDKSALHLWFAATKMRSIIDSIEGAGFALRNLIIWNKLKAHYGALGAQYKERKEPMWYAFKKGKSCRWYGENNECTVWDVDQPRVNELHPTMKPISLYVRSVKNHTKNDDIVLEMFSGSGTTLIACEQTNRICYGMEIDPQYCDVIRKRYAKFIGKEDEWQTLTKTS